MTNLIFRIAPPLAERGRHHLKTHNRKGHDAYKIGKQEMILLSAIHGLSEQEWTTDLKRVLSNLFRFAPPRPLVLLDAEKYSVKSKRIVKKNFEVSVCNFKSTMLNPFTVIFKEI